MQWLVVSVLAASGAVHGASQPTLRGSRHASLENKTWVVDLNATSGARVMEKEVQHIFNLINSPNGVLVHSIQHGAEIIAQMKAANGEFKWDTKFGDGVRALNDCYRYDNQYCSAWSFIQKDLMPMVYNYPLHGNMQHAVALMVDRKKVEHMIQRMHVIDGDTWDRFPGGMHQDDSLRYHGSEPKVSPYVCVPISPPNANTSTHFDPFYNESARRFEAHVGENGEYWPQHFQDSKLTKKYTMVRQCHFEYGSWDAWRGALAAFYARAKEQVLTGQVGNKNNAPDGALYLENEVTLQINIAEDFGSFGEGILAVTVQDNLCEEQLKPFDHRKEFCSRLARHNEIQVIEEGREAACRLSNQLSHQYRRLVPVIQARFLSNALVNLEAWNEFSSSGAYAEKYMEPYDCCARYSDLHDYSCS